MSDGQEYDAVFVSRDSNNDLAVLKVIKAEKGREFPFLKIDTNDAYGENLAAIGHPHSWPSVYLSLGKATEGPVDPSHETWRRSDAVIRFDAHVQPGNSGGPVIDGCGSARAVTVGKAGDGIAYAIPSRAVQNLLKWTGDQVAGRVYKQDGLSLGNSELAGFGAAPIKLPPAKLEPSPYNGPLYQSPYGRIFKGEQKAAPKAYDGSLRYPYGDPAWPGSPGKNKSPQRWQGNGYSVNEQKDNYYQRKKD